MNLSLQKKDFQLYVSKQLNNLFPDGKDVNLIDYDQAFAIAIDRIEYCFRHMAYENYNKDGQTFLNHLYSDQYLTFIWFLANSIWKESGNIVVANKLYYLNKTLHAFDCMYDTRLPDIFFISHGIGTMLGKALYGDFFISMHGCTVGSHKGKYPILGKGVVLTAHSSVIGNCNIGDNVSISNYTSIFERDIPKRTLVFNDPSTGGIVLKPSKATFARQVFNVEL